MRWQKKIDEVEKESSIAIKHIIRRKLAAVNLTGRSAVEMPIPEELKRDLERALRYRSQARKKAVECLDYIQECLCGTDKEVLRRFRRASNRVAEQTMRSFLASGEEEALTEGYLKAVEAEFDRLLEQQQKIASSYPLLAQKERALYVSDIVELQYPYFPRYLKALLSQNPYLQEDPEVEQKLATISEQVSRAQSIFESIEKYAVEIYIALLRTSPEARDKFLMSLQCVK